MTETNETVLCANDILGIIQRGLFELNQYLNQNASTVNPSVVMAYLERMAQFTQQLPTHVPPEAASPASGTARAN